MQCDATATIAVVVVVFSLFAKKNYKKSLFSAFKFSWQEFEILYHHSDTITFFFHFQTDEKKKKKIPKMSCVCRRGPSLTDLLKTPHGSLAIHMAHTQCAHFERPLFVRAACLYVRACVCIPFV